MLPPNLCGDLDSTYYQVTREATAFEQGPSEQDHRPLFPGPHGPMSAVGCLSSLSVHWLGPVAEGQHHGPARAHVRPRLAERRTLPGSRWAVAGECSGLTGRTSRHAAEQGRLWNVAKWKWHVQGPAGVAWPHEEQNSQGCRRTTPSRVHGRHLPAGCLGVELGVAPAHPEGDLFFTKHGRGGPSRSGASVPCGRQISAPGPPPRTRAPAPADKHSCVFADSGLWLLAWPFDCVVHEQTRHLVKESFCSQ